MLKEMIISGSCIYLFLQYFSWILASLRMGHYS